MVSVLTYLMRNGLAGSTMLRLIVVVMLLCCNASCDMAPDPPLPVFCEWPYNDGRPDFRDWEYRIVNPGSLKRFSKKVVDENSNARLEMENGIPCILPKQAIPSALDRTISLHMSNATVWEAFKEVLMQMNCNDNTNALKFHRLLLDVGMRNFPPPSFFEGEVNIDASSITAREAILEIMRQAPMPIPVRYYHLGSSYNISLGFVIDGEIYFKDRPEDLLVPREQQVWFNQEMQDVRTCGQWEQESSDDSSAGNPDSESPVLSPSGPDTRLVPAVYEVLDADCFLWQIPNVLVDANDVQSASKKVTGLSDGSMMLELIDGIPSIHPVEDRVNDMDVLVTLQLKNVSLWEAIKAALQQMNCNKEFGYEMEPPLVMNHLYKRIPTLFFEKCMDLSVTNRPAREAFCAIAAAAPVQVGMRYSQRGSFPYRPSFGITLYEDGKPMRFTGRRWQSREEALWWENEKHEATLPAEECLPEPGEQAAGQ